ncbi:MAG: hypothetical protein H7066_08965 [Cytophagaceae bacterium]|nr:hypothetical protein [Gemmatimonadaceae bacterium]
MIPSTGMIQKTALTLATVGVLAAALTASASQARLEASPVRPADAWLKKTANARYHQLFDFPTAGGGIPLVHIMNYVDTYNKAYGVPDKDINPVGTFYGATTFFGVSDAMWAKYKIGEFLNEKDGTGQAFTRNPWREAPVILGMELRAASIETLQQRGSTFILCNNALTIFSGMLAKALGLEATNVYNDLKANILPGVELIPGMVVAIEQAQSAGLSYHRQ